MQRLRRRKWVAAIALGAMLLGQGGAPMLYAQGAGGEAPGANDRATATPIQHVVLIIGENRTFDHLFGTFRPNPGQSVMNLLSEGIVNSDGTPGPNFARAQQWQASDTGSYSVHPDKTEPFSSLPQPTTGGAPTNAPFASVSAAEEVEPALPQPDYTLLTIGGTGLPSGLDTRFPADLADGPFDITNYISWNDYAGSPVHRFFQMWQQADCDSSAATQANPSGCQEDLFPWVEVSVATGSNGKPEPANFSGEGALSMGYYDVEQGDMRYFNRLAHQFALSDNYHQAIMGGTGANHLAIGYGTTIFYADANGNPAVPPSNQIENPNPQPGTNNFYTQDGYSGGSYVNCSDSSQPGVGAVDAYLASLPYPTFRNGDCETGGYYLVNNYNPGYLGTGQPAPLGANQFTVPPTQQPNLGTLLLAHQVSWRYYGEGWADGQETGENSTYCNICNPFLYSTQIMTNATTRQNNLGGIRDLYSDIAQGRLPAVSIVKPDGYLDGHPASSKFELFEAFCKKIIDQVRANPELWKNTAILITVDEGGGYYDSGYIQPLDFFGDGTRIPLLVVSPYSEGVGMVHSYTDHVSFAKFVEANWKLQPISDRSRDNLPNPIAMPGNPYVPSNSPAIGDLMDMFNFKRHRGLGQDRGNH
ncbi:MAG TPA: alkaline phosphatase family protein [Candidatus Binataceae bacterium]|nr:alkaline phosphatase family protein [Candidatus Binataceae bacterium]